MKYQTIDLRKFIALIKLEALFKVVLDAVHARNYSWLSRSVQIKAGNAYQNRDRDVFFYAIIRLKRSIVVWLKKEKYTKTQ